MSETSEVKRRYCRFHMNCKNKTPEHSANFICEYQRDCKFGDNCNKKSDEMHSKYFTHKTTTQLFTKIDKKPQNLNLNIPKTPHVQRPPLNDKNSKLVNAVFKMKVTYVGDNKVEVSGDMNIRVPTEFDHDETYSFIRDLIYKQYLKKKKTESAPTMDLDIDSPEDEIPVVITEPLKINLDACIQSLSV